jgi:hypothetical protein
MGSNTKTDKKLTNGEILIISKVLKHVMSSAAEAEIGAVLINAKEGAALRTTLEELGHKHPLTPMETDNTTVTGYSNGTIKQKRTKAMDMRFYWITDRVKQGQFNVYWGPEIKIWRIISQNIIRRRIIKECARFTSIPKNNRLIGKEFEIPHYEGVVIPQVRPAHKYPIPPWEMIHLPGGDNAVCM